MLTICRSRKLKIETISRIHSITRVWALTLSAEGGATPAARAGFPFIFLSRATKVQSQGEAVNAVAAPRKPPRAIAATAAAANPAQKFSPGAAVAYSRSEEHTSELQSLMRHSYAVF